MVVLLVLEPGTRKGSILCGGRREGASDGGGRSAMEGKVGGGGGGGEATPPGPLPLMSLAPPLKGGGLTKIKKCTAC